MSSRQATSLRDPTRRRFLSRSALAALGWLTLPACGGAGARDLSARARELHRESFVLDLHVDSILWTRMFGYDLGREHRNRVPFHPFGWHVDWPRAIEGGLDAAVMGLVINPDEVRPELMLPLRILARFESGERDRGLAQTLATLDLLAEEASRHPDRFALVLRGSELETRSGDGRVAGLAGLEGSHGIGGDLAGVARAYERGLRMIGLVHFQATEVGYPMTVASFDGQGLTPYGRDMLSEMDRLGIVADIAHLNAAGVDDVLASVKRPFVVSHTACAAVHDHPRNLTDDQLRRIAAAGGVVGIAVGRSFLGGAHIDRFLDHVEHAARVAGPDAVAIGSDWDGFIVPVDGLEDVRGLPNATAGLLARGWDEDAIRGFLGRNALRVLVDVTG
ncbi:MAG: dipeptidase [Myxococcota bacterium]